MIEILKTYRTKEGLSFQKMAELIGVSKAYYWQIENEERRLTYSLANKIADVFHARPDSLFYESFEKKQYKKRKTR